MLNFCCVISLRGISSGKMSTRYNCSVCIEDVLLAFQPADLSFVSLDECLVNFKLDSSKYFIKLIHFICILEDRLSMSHYFNWGKLYCILTNSVSILKRIIIVPQCFWNRIPFDKNSIFARTCTKDINLAGHRIQLSIDLAVPIWDYQYNIDTTCIIQNKLASLEATLALYYDQVIESQGWSVELLAKLIKPTFQTRL